MQDSSLAGNIDILRQRCSSILEEENGNVKVERRQVRIRGRRQCLDWYFRCIKNMGRIMSDISMK